MESRSISARPDVSITTTSPRVTPTPPRASRFGEVLSNTVVRSAESAMRLLPGAPVMALAVRGAGGPGSINVPMTPSAGPISSARGPEGPMTSAGARLGAPHVNVAAGSAPGSAANEGATLESSLQQSQDMNIYYLQIQESVNAQNRQFTALSNVLKAEHDTVKTAIGNIR